MKIVQTLQELNPHPQRVGQEAKAQAYVERLYRSLGLEVVSPVPEHGEGEGPSGFHRNGRVLRGPANVVGTFPGNGSGPS